MGVPHDLDWYGSRGNSSEFTSEKKLAVALLVDALRMIQERSAESKEALNWLMGRAGYRDDWVFSAESVCDALNIDIAALRARLRCLVAPLSLQPRSPAAGARRKKARFCQRSPAPR